MAEAMQEENDLVEVELEDSSPAQPEPAAPVDTGSDDGDDDLQSYSKNVQNRIRKLTERMRKEERDRQEATRLAEQLMQENQQLKTRVQRLDTGYLQEYGARLTTQMENARRAYKMAVEANDSDAMLKAQEALSNLAVQKQRYDAVKARNAAPQGQAAQQPQGQPVAQQPAAQQPQRPADPKAKAWAEKNKWFGEDRMLTSAAFAIHATLVEDEGFDPQSDEYYTELDRRIRSEFPNKFRPVKSGVESSVASAGSSASRSTKQGRGTVKLTPSQVAMAKRLNVPLTEYAKYVKE